MESNCEEERLTQFMPVTAIAMRREQRILHLDVRQGAQWAYTCAMAERVGLKASVDRKGRFSGYYECSLCGTQFRPNPKYPMEMMATFRTHTTFSHPLEAKLAVNVDPPMPPKAAESEGRG